jgi:hypothetical protein
VAYFDAAALWLLGMIFEAGGDAQLARFKSDATNRGKILDQGLWRFTRHPNYFGDFCVWWGFYLIAAAAGAWWGIVGPLIMSVLTTSAEPMRFFRGVASNSFHWAGRCSMLETHENDWIGTNAKNPHHEHVIGCGLCRSAGCHAAAADNLC